MADADQALESSYKHGMRAPNQTVQCAKEEAERYLSQEITSARSLEAAGKHPEALMRLGNATHLLQDMTDPMHAGFQEWNNNYIDRLVHTAGEFYDPGKGSPLDYATMKVYGYFVGTVPLPKRYLQ